MSISTRRHPRHLPEQRIPRQHGSTGPTLRRQQRVPRGPIRLVTCADCGAINPVDADECIDCGRKGW